MTIAPAEDTRPAELQGIADAVGAWSRVLPTRIEVGAPSVAAADALTIRFESGDAFYRAIYWDAWGEIAISRARLHEDDYAVAIAHELGHAFGLFHVPADQRLSVMNEGNLEAVPDEVDAQAVADLWAACSE